MGESSRDKTKKLPKAAKVGRRLPEVLQIRDVLKRRAAPSEPPQSPALRLYSGRRRPPVRTPEVLGTPVTEDLLAPDQMERNDGRVATYRHERSHAVSQSNSLHVPM
jgi:hypothetical protein